MKARLDKLQKASQSFKQKFVESTKAKKHLEKSIKGQHSVLREVTQKHQNTLSKLQSTQQDQIDQQQQMSLLNTKLKTLETAAKALKQQMTQLEKDNVQYGQLLMQREKQILIMKEREELLEQLKQAVAASEGGLQVMRNMKIMMNKNGRVVGRVVMI